ncbi:hypothetical protein HNP49_003425 [Pseudomonas fluvialis]|uniref:Uncharacterized protein n=1 Tax=Pseudomonas fluvialis TaxID=1793966 RepID=A0A7X0BUN5_9PSED|nr:hypothetical protein [Pseudomonas fluvialis]MBB6343227.1 hypothetical protein [Pseudomonas fluvialis]
MKRRIFLSGALVAGGALAGHLATKRLYLGAAPASSPADFAEAMAGVRLQYVSHELLLDLYARAVSEDDRNRVVREVVNHNRNLFVANAYDRQHGNPGFYRVAG